jgi:hypothetical protein
MRNPKGTDMNWKTIVAALALCGAAGTAGAVGNLADITVYDRAEGRTLPVHRHHGRYYVVGKPGNEYQVRVRNRTGSDILTVISVDGVNAVNGETASWDQTGYVLSPHQAYDVKGWRKSTDRTAAFFFTEHQNSYAARTGRPDNVGVIGVAVFRRKVEPVARIDVPAPRQEAPAAGPREDSPYPANSETTSRGSGLGGLSGPGAARSAPEGAANDSRDYSHSPQPLRRSPSLGTGHGRSETSHITYTSFERATSAPEDVIAIHYNTHANLVAMGVIRGAPPRVAVPTPFPGQFVPDPR